ncbi:TIGR02186 family protein [Sphingomonas morindae]|uniref:TIGR02186 family protein n=1 Tax=Sphingomonas morindae TaxID=1541170 RepID=A0ABY4XBB9_9SPHN|nr:TIGR02186 family protein [Sphingomonas morindae]USI74275.1 TIGR02186 family protein [Sphingomonas morindae]
MSRAARRLAPALAALLCLGAAKPVLVPDVSDDSVRILYSFAGDELLLFGAILYPGGIMPDRPADIAIVLKGPTESVIVRQKRKIAGIWVNAESARFRSAPSFYAVASSRPIDRLVDARTAFIYELGLDSLQMSPVSGALPEEQRRFKDGLIALKRRAGLYREEAGGVAIRDHVLYRARIAIPARVPVGRYTAETFLIQDGRVVAAAVREVRVAKTGFERLVAQAARRWSIAYGLVAVALSLVIGWGAGALFRRI